jgi:hypothetical protein
MNYDAVCASASRLFDLVCTHPELINEAVRPTFEFMIPQLANLDASSARGRFLLRIFSDGWFVREFVQTVEKTRVRLHETLGSTVLNPIIPRSAINGHLDRSQI